jgi:hypothetical protein
LALSILEVKQPYDLLSENRKDGGIIQYKSKYLRTKVLMVKELICVSRSQNQESQCSRPGKDGYPS